MNVNHYFLGSPDFATPAIIIHSGVKEALDPDELAALMDLWQNPLYPDDAYFTEDMFNAEARAKSMQRAETPSVKLCLLETVDSETHPLHTHTYSECMDYRANQDISPQAPWTYWSEYDSYPFGPPPVILPPAIHGWNAIARVNRYGISEMNGWAGGWQGYTFVVQIGASQFITAGYGSGLQTRLMLAGSAIFKDVFIGPATNMPFVASVLHPVTFGGQNQFQIDSTYSDGGIAMPYTRMSDFVPMGIDAPNGLIVSGYVVAPPSGGSSGYVQTYGYEPDWYSRGIAGNHSADLDKSKLGQPNQSGWFRGGVSSIALMMVEGYYP